MTVTNYNGDERKKVLFAEEIRRDAVAMVEMVVEGNEEAKISISSRWPYLVDASDHVQKAVCDASGGPSSFKRVDGKS